MGFHREIGQLYKSTLGNNGAESRTDRTSRQRRRCILECLRLIVQAGLSIELVDGETKTVNKEIIIQLLELLKS